MIKRVLLISFVQSVSKILGGDQGPAVDSPTIPASNAGSLALPLSGLKNSSVKGLRLLDIGNCQAVNYPKSITG